MTDPIHVDYAPQPKPTRRSSFKRLAASLGTAAGIVVMLAYALRSGPSAEIRLDTGDLRYLYWGIPFQYRWMPEPARSQLIVLSAGSNTLKPEWHSCATRVGSNNADGMCQGFYRKATAWIAVDPHLARMIANDIANYVRNTGVRQGLPDSFGMLAFVLDMDNKGSWHVKPGWQQDEMVMDYLQRKGYSLPATKPAG